MAYKDGTRSGGRKPGSKNKLTTALKQIRDEAIKKINEDLGPDAFKGDGVAFLQAIYKSPHFDADMRMDAATRASQFERAKKTESTIEDKREYVVRMPAPVASLDEWKKLYMNEPQTIEPATDAEWAARLAKIAAEAKDKAKN
jgi:hypothetical protein